MLTKPLGVSNRTKSNQNSIELNRRSHRSIAFGNRTKSNIYFAVSSIIEPIKQNPTQPDSIRFEFVWIHFLSHSNFY